MTTNIAHEYRHKSLYPNLFANRQQRFLGESTDGALAWLAEFTDFNLKQYSEIVLARTLAIHAHREQKYGDQPYFVHLDGIVNCLAGTRLDVQPAIQDPDIYIAAYLHDTLEDTDLQLSLITDLLGERVAGMVLAVTGKGQNRQAQQALIRKRIKLFPEALPIKLADRVCNVQACWSNRDSRLFMYQKEHKDFCELKEIQSEYPIVPYLWNYLDKLLAG